VTSEPPVPNRSRRTGGSASRRGPILLVVVAVLIVGGLIDRVGAPAAAPAAPVVEPVPVAAPAAAVSSSWFCAGATLGAAGSRTSGVVGSASAPGTVVIANSSPNSVNGTVTLVSSQGRNREVPIQVGPQSSWSVPETVPGASGWVGAIVDVDGGGVAVDQLITAAQGRSAQPCASSGSTHWYFPSGMTLINAGEAISLLNPYPTDSIVDLSFSTNQGVEQPQDFQGIDVPADGLVTVDLGSHLRRRSSIATTVTARTGNVVAWETQWVNPPAPGATLIGTPAANNPLSDPAWPVSGMAVTLGSPSAGTSWTWPDGLAGAGIDESYVIYNPGSATAEVRLSLNLQQGSAEPFDLAIGAGQVVPVVSAQQARIPAGVSHSAVLQSTNGVPVVAARVVSASGFVNGIGSLLGGRLSASRWLVPLAIADRHGSGRLVLYNPGATTARATVRFLFEGQQVPVNGLGPITVPAGQRVSVPVPALRGGGGPLLISSSAAVYVESDAYGRLFSRGVSLAWGVPLSS
jgi:Family of unknown function (DUF5719)